MPPLFNGTGIHHVQQCVNSSVLPDGFGKYMGMMSIDFHFIPPILTSQTNHEPHFIVGFYPCQHFLKDRSQFISLLRVENKIL